MSLKKQAFSGVRWTTYSSLGRAALQIIQIAILARFLAPEDFGLIAIVIAIMAFIQVFADAGISNAIIHYQDITPEELSSLYWLNVSVSVCLALIVTLASSWVSLWYHYPELQYLLILAGVVLVFGAIGQQIRVLAQKNLRFASLAKVELIAAVAGFVTAVYLAWMGVGVYALIGGSLMGAAVGSLLVWLRLSEGWRPLMRLRIGEIHKFLKFGAYMIGNNLVNTFNSQVDILLGGRLLGAQVLGLYSIPKDLSLRISGVINPIITNVGLPIMAKIQSDEALLKRVYLQTMRMTASVNCPLYVALGLFAPEVVHLLLGSKWDGAIPLLQVFSVYALLRSMGNPVGSLLLAKGRADLSFKWNLMLLCVIPPCIWMGSWYGAMGMAIAMTGLGIFFYIPGWYFLIRPLCGATLIEYSVQSAVPLIIALMAGGISYVVAQYFVVDWARLMVGLLVGAVFYLLLSWKFNRVWFDSMLELLGMNYSVKEKLRD